MKLFIDCENVQLSMKCIYWLQRQSILNVSIFCLSFCDSVLGDQNFYHRENLNMYLFVSLWHNDEGFDVALVHVIQSVVC